MAFVEMTAKTVDEAVAKALKELNITAEEKIQLYKLFLTQS